MMRDKILSILVAWAVVTTTLLPLRAEPPIDPKPVMTLKDCVDLGLQTFVPLKLAEEEVELARLKRQEAHRAFYPAMSVKAEETTGEVVDPTKSPNFTERNYGATMSYDVFGGGRISGTYQQALASHLAAELSRDKTMHDFIYSVREAYWNLASAQVILAERESVRVAIKEDLKKITEQYVLDLAVKQQFLAVKSQFLQANTQANLAAKNYSKARWDLAKALGVPKPLEKNVLTVIPNKKVDIDLDSCLILASTHRPDLRMQDLLVDVALGARRVASASRFPKVTFNSFYGRSASAYEGDPLIYKEDWQLSANIVQSFLGSSVGLTGSAVDTSPKLGQSTRTNTESKGASLNLLDGMKNRTEYKQSDLAYRQAALKRDDLKKDVAIDVEGAYYSLVQSRLQLEFSEEDEKLADEELRVVESKGRYGITGVLEMAQARNRLAQSKTARMEALSGYQVALAALNRAVGIPDKFLAE